jgi:hypothetical protein
LVWLESRHQVCFNYLITYTCKSTILRFVYYVRSAFARSTMATDSRISWPAFLWVHVIKATQYTGLKATPKYTGKKATKTYRNIGYNEYTGSKATAFLNTQEKRLHFLNIQEKRLHFWIYNKKATFSEYTRYSHNDNSLSAIFN